MGKDADDIMPPRGWEVQLRETQTAAALSSCDLHMYTPLCSIGKCTEHKWHRVPGTDGNSRNLRESLRADPLVNDPSHSSA
jgi:hypothetical protein